MSRTFRRAAPLLALALLTPLAATAPARAAADAADAAADPATSVVPYPMDSSNQAGWWSPVATHKGAGSYTYFAFNEPAADESRHKVAVARRAPSGEWTKLPVRQRDGKQAEYADDIGHNQPSVARDGSGRLHVFASMHNDTWRYFRSDAPGGASGDPVNHAGDLPDQGKGITYPVVTTAPNGDLYLIARVDVSGSARHGGLYHWDDSASKWSKVADFAGAENRSVYPDDIQTDAQGRVHLLFEWASHPAAVFRHQLSYLRYDPADGTFRDSAGAREQAPVTPATADTVQPVTAGEEWTSDPAYAGPAVQSAKLALDGGRPKVAYRYRHAGSEGRFDVRYGYLRDGRWARQTVHAGAQTRAAVGITWDEQDGKRVYFAKSAGADRAFAATESGGKWTAASVAPGVPAERLAVRRDADGGDVLYLADVAGGRLHYGRR
ncbi:BNR-4 repeat-containing protein [Streptomyces sp. NPDC048172]|uniref:BNR-4 repeat-containing protein n=1 Tax=Streptomyces sp. NPDC048172 TaxID=3365505 RepID=UPI003714CF17